MSEHEQQSVEKPVPALSDAEAAVRLREAHSAIRAELAQIIVGQEDVIDQMLIAVFSRGHVILEGVPGLAKTLLISSVAKCLGLAFSRIQFTPDLMPSDIIGTEVIQEDRRTGQRSFRFLKGPVFANVILADEVNRTPPKTQAALLEAMQEGQVTVGGTRHVLDPPFFVLATQNPIEQEGTYPLPEAQQDRFMFKVLVSYPKYEDEFAIAERTTGERLVEPKTQLEKHEILQIQDLVRRVPVASPVIHYALELVRCTRPHQQESDYLRKNGESGRTANPAADIIDRMVSFGAGPRAVQNLLVGAKAWALIQGRNHVAIEDIRDLARPVLRHRIITNYTADAEGRTSDDIVNLLMERLSSRHVTEGADGDFAQVLRS